MGLQVTPGVTDVTATSPIVSSGAPTPNITRNANADYAATAAQSITLTDATTGNVSTALSLSHNTTGTPAIDLGVQLSLKGQSSTTTDRLMAFIRTHWSVVTDASRAAYLSFAAAQGGNDPTTERFYIFGSGGASLYTKQDSGAGIFYVETGIQIGSIVPASGLFPQSDGTKYVPSAFAVPASVGAIGTDWQSNGASMVSGDHAAWQEVHYVTSADATTTSTTLVDVTGLVSNTLAISSTYEFEAVLLVATTADANGTKYGVHCSVAPTTIIANYFGPTTVSLNVQTMTFSGSMADNVASAGFLSTASEVGVIVIKGYLVTAGSGSPVFSIRHLKITSGTSTVSRGSTLKIRKVST
jgi:hypothetical protein